MPGLRHRPPAGTEPTPHPGRRRSSGGQPRTQLAGASPPPSSARPLSARRAVVRRRPAGTRSRAGSRLSPPGMPSPRRGIRATSPSPGGTTRTATLLPRAPRQAGPPSPRLRPRSGRGPSPQQSRPRSARRTLPARPPRRPPHSYPRCKTRMPPRPPIPPRSLVRLTTSTLPMHRGRRRSPGTESRRRSRGPNPERSPACASQQPGWSRRPSHRLALSTGQTGSQATSRGRLESRQAQHRVRRVPRGSSPPSPRCQRRGRRCPPVRRSRQLPNRCGYRSVRGELEGTVRLELGQIRRSPLTRLALRARKART